jgi:hypothetical protein
MHTINRRLLHILLGAGLVGFVTVGCSSQQQQDEELESTDDEAADQQNVGEDDAAEGNGQDNFVENDEGTNNEAMNNSQGAELNNDTADEATEDTGTETVNATLDNTGGGNTSNTSMNAPPPEPAPPVNNTAAMAPPPASAGGGAGAPVPGGRVRYIKSSGTQVMSGPGGSPVRTLDQGDHPVTWEENGWLRIADGMYVPMDAVSDAGVPRTTGPRAWSH